MENRVASRLEGKKEDFAFENTKIDTFSMFCIVFLDNNINHTNRVVRKQQNI